MEIKAHVLDLKRGSLMIQTMMMMMMMMKTKKKLAMSQDRVKALIYLLAIPHILSLNTASADSFHSQGYRTTHGHSPSSRLNLSRFRAYQLSVFQGDERSFTGGVSWNPRYLPGTEAFIVGNLAIAPILGVDQKLFFTTTYEVLVSFAGQPWEFEVGGGAQTWFQGPSSTSVILSANALYRFDTKLLSVIDALWLGYSILPAGKNPSPDTIESIVTHQLKLGVEF